MENRMTVQVSKENRITFFSFENSDMDIEKMITNFVKEYGDCPPQIIGFESTVSDKERLDSLMKKITNIYYSNQTQLPLFPGYPHEK